MKCQQRQIRHCSKTEELNFSVLFSNCYLTVSFGFEWFCYCEKWWIIIPYSPFLHNFKIIYLRLLFYIDSFMLCSFDIFNIMSCLSLLFSTWDSPSLFCLTSISVMWSSKFPLFEICLVPLYYSRDYHLQIYTYVLQTAILNDFKSFESLMIASTCQSKNVWIELLFPCVCYFALMPSKSGHQCGRTAAVSLGNNSRLYQVWLSKAEVKVQGLENQGHRSQHLFRHPVPPSRLHHLCSAEIPAEMEQDCRNTTLRKGLKKLS